MNNETRIAVPVQARAIAASLAVAPAGGWRLPASGPSLPESAGSVATPRRGTFWRKLAAFMGPGYLVAVGYMDPGNWATSLSAGAKFGFLLLAVALISNLMAVVLQSLSARLGVGAGRDLAQACRDAFPGFISIPLWILAEIAIAATDLAEVIGTAIGINLLFGIPLELGVVITAADVFIVLAMQSLGFRWVETFVVALLAVIAACFAAQIAMADPDWGAVIRGFTPSVDILTDRDKLYLALGILGATVMPHNLYLHSALVRTRAYGESARAKREAILFSTIDSTLALTMALAINAAILILAAATFHKAGQTDIAELDQAHRFLAPMLGSTLAPTLFAVALIACGLNSTVTATLSGQVVMEGFVNIRLRPWLRRMVTRAIAIVPAAAVTLWAGRKGASDLLIFSQVILSLQLPFAVIPLVMFTASRAKMGAFVAPRWLTVLAIAIAGVIVALNLKLVADVIAG